MIRDMPCPNTSSLLCTALILLLWSAHATPANPNSIAILDNIPSDFHVSCHTTFQPILISSHGSFAMGLLLAPSSSSSTCSLSVVCYKCRSYYVVWSACCDEDGGSISTAAMVRLGEHRNIELVKEDAMEALWRSSATGVVAMELLETGNLIMLGGNNDIVWQSFLNPSDVLLPGQILTPGMSLRSGSYSAAMEAGGFALYANVSSRLLPYMVVNASWDLTDVVSVKTPICNGLSLVYSADGLTLMMEVELGSTPLPSAPCSYSALGSIKRFNRTIAMGNVTLGSGFRYLKLGSDGDLRRYVEDEAEFTWFHDDLCNLPNHCGELGICHGYSDGECRCPHTLIPFNQTVEALANTSSFVSADYTVETLAELNYCIRHIRPFNSTLCTDQFTNPNHSSLLRFDILLLQDLDYFPHRFLPKLSLTIDDCVSSCMHNCSCTVAFYHNRTKACFHYESALSMKRASSAGGEEEYLVFLKLTATDTNTEGEDQKKGENQKLNMMAIAIILGTSLVVCLIIFLWVYASYGGRGDMEDGRRFSRPVNDDVFRDSLAGMPPRYTFKELQEATKGFSVKLGTGGFGSVYEGAIAAGSVKVAVKKLEGGSRQGDKEFRAEVAALTGISHVNLVRLLGFCAEGPHRMLVYEYLPLADPRWRPLFSSSS